MYTLTTKEMRRVLREFFGLLYGDVPAGLFTNIVGFNGRKGAAFVENYTADAIDAAIDAVIRHKDDAGTNIYFRASYMLEMPREGRGEEKDTYGSNLLWVDLDIQKGDVSVSSTIDMLESFKVASSHPDSDGETVMLPLPPTVIIASGGGIQAFWRLSEFCCDIQALRARNTWLAQQFAEYHADHVQDLARVMRVPTTINHKYEGKPIAEIKQLDAHRIYPLDLFGWAAPNELRVPTQFHRAKLPDDFLETIKTRNEELYFRILSESTASVQKGIKLAQDGSVDRSSNDWYITRSLLGMKYTKDQVFTVLTHPRWFSGAKFRERGSASWSYASTTIHRAMQHIEVDPKKYFEGRAYIAERMYDTLVTEGWHFLLRGDIVWYYDDGVYHANGADFIKAEVRLRLRESWKSTFGEETVKICQASLFKNARDKGEEDVPPLVLPLDKIYLNVRSGMLNLGTRELRPHSPQDYSLTQLPMLYDPEQKCPAIEQFIAQVLPEDAIPAWWEFVGYCLLPDVRFRTALMLIGETRSGKSTVLNLLERFLHTRNTSSITLQEICDSRFSASGMFGKLANIYNDLATTELQNAGRFKTYVSGERVTLEKKFHDPFDFYLTAKHAYSANQYLPVTDPDNAYAERWIIIRLMRQFEYGGTGESHANTHLIDQLATPENLSGMLNLAIAGVHRLVEQERFSVGASMKAAHEDFQSTLDSVFAYLHDMTVPKENGWIAKSVLLANFRTYCSGSGRHGTGMGNAKFYHRVRALLAKFEMREGKETIDGHGVEVYRGRVLKEPKKIVRSSTQPMKLTNTVRKQG